MSSRLGLATGEVSADSHALLDCSHRLIRVDSAAFLPNSGASIKHELTVHLVKYSVKLRRRPRCPIYTSSRSDIKRKRRHLVVGELVKAE